MIAHACLRRKWWTDTTAIGNADAKAEVNLICTSAVVRLKVTKQCFEYSVTRTTSVLNLT